MIYIVRERSKFGALMTAAFAWLLYGVKTMQIYHDCVDTTASDGCICLDHELPFYFRLRDKISNADVNSFLVHSDGMKTFQVEASKLRDW